MSPERIFSIRFDEVAERIQPGPPQGYPFLADPGRSKNSLQSQPPPDFCLLAQIHHAFISHPQLGLPRCETMQIEGSRKVPCQRRPTSGDPTRLEQPKHRPQTTFAQTPRPQPRSTTTTTKRISASASPAGTRHNTRHRPLLTTPRPRKTVGMSPKPTNRRCTTLHCTCYAN